MTNKYDICVAVRVYPGISKTPKYYANDKLKLFSLTLLSLRYGLGNLKAFVYVITDGCPIEYVSIINKHLKNIEFEIVSNEYSIGNASTFLQQFMLLKRQSKAPYVMFCEDDYLFLEGSIEKCTRKLSNDSSVDFITPYTTPTYTTNRLHHNNASKKSKIDNEWVPRGSTTLTFLTSKAILNEENVEKVMLSYCKKNSDHSLWITLTKFGLLNFKSGIYEFRNVVRLVKPWIYNPRQTLFGRKFKLLSPAASLATHCEISDIAQDQNWDEVFEKYSQSI